MAIVRALPGGDGSVRVQSLNELLNVLAFQDEFNGAGDLAREALELTAELPPDSAHRIVALEHLAKYHSVQGDHHEAVRLNREAVALSRTRWGEDHPRQLVALNNVGINLRRMEDLDGAESAYKGARRVDRASFGEEFPNQWLLGNLAGVHYAKGELEEAMRLYLKARQTMLDTAGSQHWRVYYYDLRIARTRNRQGAAAAAEAELRRAIDLWRPELGDHWRIDEGLSVLGESISVQGRCVEAEPLLVDSFERMLGKTIVRARKGFLERLRDHFERCGEPREAARYAALLEDVLG